MDFPEPPIDRFPTPIEKISVRFFLRIFRLNKILRITTKTPFKITKGLSNIRINFISLKDNTIFVYQHLKMKIQKVIDAIELWTPTNQSEEFDNVGLIIGNSDNDITGVIVSLDTTEKIIDEAIEKNCNLIVSFHPIIFKGLKKLTSNSYVEKTTIKAIENKVSIYSIHTSLDNHAEGVNYVISKKLGLINTKILIPKENNKSIGMGRIGELEKSLNENEFIIYLKDKMKTNLIRHSRFIGKKIKKIAVLGGSGAFGIDKAISQNADAYVTADLKYHNFFEANNKIVLFDIGHFESEQFTKNLIHDYLSKKFPSFAIVLATTNTNPVNYF